MISPRLAILLIPLMLSVAPAPAGLRASGCGIPVASSDPELRASFERFDRGQSPTAAKACGLFLNSIAAI